MEWHFFKNNPFVRLLFPLLTGIVFCFYIQVPVWAGLCGLATSVICILLSLFISGIYTYRWITGVFIHLALFFIACTLTSLSNEQSKSMATVASKLNYKAIVLEPVVEKEKGYKTSLKVEAVWLNDNWQVYDVHVAAFFEKDSLVALLKAGQTIEFKTNVRENEGQQNPFGFDYGRYLQLNGINGTVYLKSKTWKLADRQTKGLKQRALNLRQHLIDQFAHAGINGDELAVISALVLGYQDEISADIKQAYRVVGASHVLSVSGMHVGIVYIALGFLLNLFAGLRKSRWRYLIILVALWFYAFLTGLSPSVLRATVMFSFIVVGQMIGKPLNIYNSIAASAFFLLLYNPYLLFNIGFQLSYIAVIGIVFFHPKIYHLYYIKNLILDKIWELTAVSLAAQIATLPLCLYYFHQFPVYFWLSNLVVSPGASLLIFLSMAFLLMSPIPLLLKPLGLITSWAAKGINRAVVFLSQLPLATIHNLAINGVQSLLMVVVICFLTLWILKKKGDFLIAGLCTLFIFMVTVSYRQIKQQNNQAFCVYNSNAASAIQFVKGLQSWWLVQNIKDSARLEQFKAEANLYWNTESNGMIEDPDCFNQKPVIFRNNFFAFDTLTGLVVNTHSKLPLLKSKIKIDYLIVTGTPPFVLHDLNIGFTHLIIDQTVPVWIANEWKPLSSTIQPWLINESGAYIKRY